MTDGLLLVLSPGSLVARRDVQGVLHDIEIVSPEIVSLNGPPRLCYRYKIDAPGIGLTPADTIELVRRRIRVPEMESHDLRVCRGRRE